ncbi:MAG: 50S ribosomal protein L24 [Brevinematia bacterium]
MQKIRKGDNVVVIAGRDKGKKGEVLHTFPLANKAIVKGINIVKKSVKKSKEHPQGGFAEVETPIHISNLMLFCPKCGKGVRTGVLISGNSKVRVCKKCGYKFE